MPVTSVAIATTCHRQLIRLLGPAPSCDMFGRSGAGRNPRIRYRDARDRPSPERHLGLSDMPWKRELQRLRTTDGQSHAKHRVSRLRAEVEITIVHVREATRDVE